MQSLKELYRIGNGPSSSHTMGPRKAALQFSKKNACADSFRVTLYGSLAATGKGHLTDAAILSVMEPVAPVEIVWKPETFLPFHPNGMMFEAMNDGETRDSWTIFSVGGGALANEETKAAPGEKVYDMSTIADIMNWIDREGTSFWEYVERCEGKDIWDYLGRVWAVMRDTIEKGLNNEGVLPGGLGVRRKAGTYYEKSKAYKDTLQSRGRIYAYALATAEENAAGGEIVTAPTCGSSGVLPAVLYHLWISRGFSEMKILRALATAGIFGNVVKTNASISGAEVGCQGEIGVACAMAAAAAGQIGRAHV